MEFQKQVADTLVDAMERIDQEEYNAALAEINGLIGSAPDQVDVRMIAEVKLIERLISYKKEQEEWEYLKLTRQIYEYCEKNYATGYEAEETAADLPDRDVIWCCWLQGVEQAPAVVKKCIRSFSKFEKKIHVITAENYAEYVSLPDCIVRKWEEGIISNTHFSDLLRIALLAERGGLWIDATVFCSDTREITEILNGTDLGGSHKAYSFRQLVFVCGEEKSDHRRNQADAVELLGERGLSDALFSLPPVFCKLLQKASGSMGADPGLQHGTLSYPAAGNAGGI